MTAFIIDRDHLHEKFAIVPSRVGTIGPGCAFPRDEDRLKAGEGVPFRLYDDDGELYFAGRRLEYSDCDSFYHAESELAPLDCLGTPDAGCTEQRERNDEGQWVAL